MILNKLMKFDCIYCFLVILVSNEQLKSIFICFISNTYGYDIVNNEYSLVLHNKVHILGTKHKLLD